MCFMCGISEDQKALPLPVMKMSSRVQSIKKTPRGMRTILDQSEEHESRGDEADVDRPRVCASGSRSDLDVELRKAVATSRVNGLGRGQIVLGKSGAGFCGSVGEDGHRLPEASVACRAGVGRELQAQGEVVGVNA